MRNMYVEGERMMEYDAVRRKLGVWQKGISRKSIWRDANNLEKARTFRQFLAWYVHILLYYLTAPSYNSTTEIF